MADYDKNVDINVELKAKVSDAVTELEAALVGIKSSSAELEGSLEEAQTALSKFDAPEDISKNAENIGQFEQNLIHAKKQLEDINELGGEGDPITVKPKVDKEQFSDDVGEDLSQQLRDADIEADVAIDEEIKTGDAKSSFLNTVSDLVDEVESSMGKEHKVTPKIDHDVQFKKGLVQGNMTTKLQSVTPKITPDIDMDRIDTEEADRFIEIAEAAEVLTEKKQEATESNRLFNNAAEDSSESGAEEAKSFEQLRKEADTLAEVKNAAANANEKLSKRNVETGKSAEMEAIRMGLAGDKIEAYKEVVNEAREENKKLAEQSGDTSKKVDGEAMSFKDAYEALDGPDGLAKAKQAASDANRVLAGDAEETSEFIQREGDVSQETADKVAGFNRKMENNVDITKDMARSLRRARDITDDTSDSMRAAAEMGEIFEDGLGSLSINLGAFTVALRNFLTQVPLLLTGLGAIGAAAGGAAASILSVGGALAAVAAVGGLGMAQQIEESNANVENLSEGFQQMFKDIKSQLMGALEPLTDAAAISVFEQAIQGLVSSVGLVARALDNLTVDGDELANGARSISGVMKDIGDSVGPEFEQLLESLLYAFLNLQGEFVGGLKAIVGGLGDAINVSTELFMQIEDLGGLIDQMAGKMRQLAEVGINIGGGLIPIFSAIAVVLENVASFLNSLNDSFLEGLVTFIAITLAVNKFAGVIGSLVTILPNLVLGMGAVAGASGGLAGSIKAAGEQFGGFMRRTSGLFGGITSLVTATESLDERLKKLRLKSMLSEEGLNDLALSAINASESSYVMSDGIENVKDDLKRLILWSESADKSIEDLSDSATKLGGAELNFDKGIDKSSVAKGGGGSILGLLGLEAVTETNLGGKVSNKITDAVDTARDAVKGEDSILPDSLAGGTRGFFDAQYKGLSKLTGAYKKTGSIAVQAMKLPFLTMGALSNRLLMLIGLKEMDKDATYKKALSDNVLASTTNRVVMAIVKKIGAIWTEITAKWASVTAAYAEIKAEWTFMAASSVSTKKRIVATLVKIQEILVEWGLINSKFTEAGASLTAAVAQTIYAVAAGLATAATMALSAAVSVLTLGLDKAVAAVILLIGVIGGLAVGIIANLKAITSGATKAFNIISQVISIVVDVIITYFITAWNVMVDLMLAVWMIVKPIVDVFVMLGEALGLMGDGALGGASAMDVLRGIAEVTKGAIRALGDVFGGLFKIIGAISGIVMEISFIPFKILIAILGVVIDVISYLATAVFNKLGLGGKSAVSILMEEFGKLVEFLRDVGEGIVGIFDSMLNGLIQAMNFAVQIFNDTLGSLPFIDELSEFDTVSFRSKLEASREDVFNNEDQEENQKGRLPPTVEYREDNSTNIDQQVDADPEDQAQLSRVVTDAIEEANSFARRQQGGQ